MDDGDPRSLRLSNTSDATEHSISSAPKGRSSRPHRCGQAALGRPTSPLLGDVPVRPRPGLVQKGCLDRASVCLALWWADMRAGAPKDHVPVSCRFPGECGSVAGSRLRLRRAGRAPGARDRRDHPVFTPIRPPLGGVAGCRFRRQHRHRIVDSSLSALPTQLSGYSARSTRSFVVWSSPRAATGSSGAGVFKDAVWPSSERRRSPPLR